MPSSDASSRDRARALTGDHFRQKLCAALEHRVKAGKIELPPGMARIDALNRLTRVTDTRVTGAAVYAYDETISHKFSPYRPRYVWRSRGKPTLPEAP